MLARRCSATTGEPVTSAFSRRLSTSFSRLRSSTFSGEVSPREGRFRSPVRTLCSSTKSGWESPSSAPTCSAPGPSTSW